MPAGQPPKYKTAEALDDKIADYFMHCHETDDMPTLPGMAVYLGFCDRCSIYDQKKRGAKYSYVIKKAMARLEAVHLKKGRTMDIFVLKNHYGYVDKTETEVKTDTVQPIEVRLIDGKERV